jgi:hypothetical protein
MRGSKKDLERAILEIAKAIDPKMGEKCYTEILRITTLPEVVKLIVYDMFVNNFSNSDHAKQIVSLKEYARELSNDGFVKFEENYIEKQ